MEISFKSITAIVCLTAIEIVCLVTGNDGVTLMPIAALIGGIAGYGVGKTK